MIRETITNSLITAGRTLGQLSGLELAVEVSDHSIETTMEQPDEDNRAWDRDMYKRGNLFVSGYANPVKPRVHYNRELENPNELDVKEGSGHDKIAGQRIADCEECSVEDVDSAADTIENFILGEADAENHICETHANQISQGQRKDNYSHVQLISSGRYREYMRQDLISQLLTPESRWNLLVWAGIAIAVLQFFNIIIVLWATGSFQ